MRARQKGDNHRSPIMKRTERQHLKDNELQRVGREAREMIERRRSETTAIAAVVAVVAVVALGYVTWRQQVPRKASGLLAQAAGVQRARVGAPARTRGGTSFMP